MPYSKEVIRRASQILAQRRADKESQINARLQEAYRQQPQLQQIDIQLRSTMAKAARSVFTQGGDAVAVMEQIRQENQALQEQRRKLVETYFAPGYLDEESICDHCGGTGYVGSTMCSCLKELCRQEQRKELGAVFTGTESFETFRLDYYPDAVDSRVGVSPRAVMQKVLDGCTRYARSFCSQPGNLLLSGGTGLGKTHLALSIGKAVGEQGYHVCYETAIGLFSKLERAKFAPTEDALEQVQRLEECDLLIVDDLGTEMPGQFVTAALYGLLNQRLMSSKPMVITTNLNVEEAAQRYSPQIASRLQGDFFRMTCLGTDIRVLKNKEH